jgi:hypothetical protein
LAAPTLARNSGTNSHTAKATEAPASSTCHAYQQAADGSTYRLHVTERDRLAYLYTSRGTAGWYTVRGPLPLWQCLHDARLR